MNNESKEYQGRDSGGKFGSGTEGGGKDSKEQEIQDRDNGKQATEEPKKWSKDGLTVKQARQNLESHHQAVKDAQKKHDDLRRQFGDNHIPTQMAGHEVENAQFRMGIAGNIHSAVAYNSPTDHLEPSRLERMVRMKQELLSKHPAEKPKESQGSLFDAPEKPSKMEMVHGQKDKLSGDLGQHTVGSKPAASTQKPTTDHGERLAKHGKEWGHKLAMLAGKQIGTSKAHENIDDFHSKVSQAYGSAISKRIEAIKDEVTTKYGAGALDTPHFKKFLSGTAVDGVPMEEHFSKQAKLVAEGAKEAHNQYVAAKQTGDFSYATPKAKESRWNLIMEPRDKLVQMAVHHGDQLSYVHKRLMKDLETHYGQQAKSMSKSLASHRVFFRDAYFVKANPLPKDYQNRNERGQFGSGTRSGGGGASKEPKSSSSPTPRATSKPPRSPSAASKPKGGVSGSKPAKVSPKANVGAPKATPKSAQKPAQPKMEMVHSKKDKASKGLEQHRLNPKGSRNPASIQKAKSLMEAVAANTTAKLWSIDAVRGFADHVSKMHPEDLKQFIKENGLRSNGKIDALVYEATISGQERSRWQQKCRKEGIRPKDFKAMSNEIRDTHNDYVQKYNQMISPELSAKARELQESGKDYDSLTAGGGDRQRIAFDEIAEQAFAANPEFFAGKGNPEEQYWDMLIAGKQPLMTKEESFRQAFDRLYEMKQRMTPPRQQNWAKKPKEELEPAPF